MSQYKNASLFMLTVCVRNYMYYNTEVDMWYVPCDMELVSCKYAVAFFWSLESAHSPRDQKNVIICLTIIITRMT